MKGKFSGFFLEQRDLGDLNTASHLSSQHINHRLINYTTATDSPSRRCPVCVRTIFQSFQTCRKLISEESELFYLHKAIHILTLKIT